MTRPQPGDIAPNVAERHGDVLTLGNLALDPYFSDNYDLGLEWYFGRVGSRRRGRQRLAEEIEGYTTSPAERVCAVRLARHRLHRRLPSATRRSACRPPRTSAVAERPGACRIDQRHNTSELITLTGW
jgi:hypothetical protein